MAGGEAKDEVLDMLRHLWVEAYADACERVETVEAYVGPRLAGVDSPEALAEAIGAAHKLAGTLGTFGLPTGSELGRSIEHQLEAGTPDDATVIAVAEQLVTLRALLDAAAPDTAPEVVEQVAPQDDDRTTGTAVVIGGTRSLVEAIRFEIQRRGLTLLGALADVEHRPAPGQLAFIDIADDASLIPEISHAHRRGMVVVATGVRPDFELRMALVAAGADLVLDRDTSAADVVQLALQLRDRLTLDPRVAIVDRDPEVAGSLAAELAVVGCPSGTLEFGPDLGAPPPTVDAVLVGGSMSAAGVGDIITTLRADPHWDRVTLLALRAVEDPTHVRASFGAADDVVARDDGPSAIAQRIRAAVRRRQAIADATVGAPVTGDIVMLPETTSAPRAATIAIVVDDDPTITGLLTEVLQREGFTVRVFADGLAAADALSDPAELDGVAFVLLDVSLPGLNGFGVLRQMRAAGTLETVPVAMLTARSSDEDVVTAWELGVTDHIAKPFSVPVLTQHVRKLAHEAVTA